jgi:hypothetical protein
MALREKQSVREISRRTALLGDPRKYGLSTDAGDETPLRSFSRYEMKDGDSQPMRRHIHRKTGN